MKQVVKRGGPNGIGKAKKEKNYLSFAGKFGTDGVKSMQKSESEA